MHWNRWRRAAALVLGMGAVLAVGAPVAAHEVYTGRATIVAAYAEWGTFDWERMVGNDTLVAIQEAGDGMFAIGYQALRLTEVTCTNGTATTRDDVQGSRGTVSMGDGIASAASVDTRQLRWARATGTVEVYKYSFDTCTGESDLLSVKSVTIALDLAAAGRARRSHDRFGFIEPGSFLASDTYSEVVRPARGTATIGSRTRTITPDVGVISRVRLRTHYVVH